MTKAPARPSAATPPAPDDDLAGLSYEQARDELVTVVATLEAGAASLEESLALWERGEALAARCQQWLDGARERLAAVRGPQNAAGATSAAESSGSSTGADDLDER